MSILDGRQAVQERLDAIEAEATVLRDLLSGYERLEALTQPGQGKGPLDRDPVGVQHLAPVTEPEAGDAPPVAVPPASHRHRKETFVCSRCPATFKTRGWRDRHEAKHEPVPDVAPSSGERIRRIPPTVRRGYQLPGKRGVAVPV